MGLLGRIFKQDETATRRVPGKLMSDETARKLKSYQDRANEAIAANPGAVPDMSADPEVVQARAAADMADALREKIGRWSYEPEDSFGFCPDFNQNSLYFAWRSRP